MDNVVQPSVEERISAALSPEPPAETQQSAPEALVSHEPDPLPEQNHELNALEAPESPVEETSPESDSEPTLEENVAENASDEAVEEITIDSLTALADHLGVDASDLYNVAIPISEDGVRKDVTLGDLKDGAQTSQKARREAEEARALREQLVTEQQQLHEQFEQHNAAVSSYLQSAHDVLTKEYQSVDWNALQQEDPGRAAWLNQQYQQRNAELQNSWARANAEYEQNKAQLAQSAQQHLEQHLIQEEQQLLSKVPEWKDAKVREAETSKLKDYLLDTGFTEPEIQRAYDHKMLVLARKGMLYDQMVTKANVAKQKVVKLGSKVLKPGARQSKADQQKSRTDNLRAAARKTGKVDDAALAISARLNPK